MDNNIQHLCMSVCFSVSCKQECNGPSVSAAFSNVLAYPLSEMYIYKHTVYSCIQHAWTVCNNDDDMCMLKNFEGYLSSHSYFIIFRCYSIIAQRLAL